MPARADQPLATSVGSVSTYLGPTAAPTKVWGHLSPLSRGTIDDPRPVDAQIAVEAQGSDVVSRQEETQLIRAFSDSHRVAGGVLHHSSAAPRKELVSVLRSLHRTSGTAVNALQVKLDATRHSSHSRGISCRMATNAGSSSGLVVGRGPTDAALETKSGGDGLVEFGTK